MSAYLDNLPDSRVQLTSGGEGVQGWECVACGHRVSLPAPWCPRCRNSLRACDLGSSGVVWSSTVLRVPLPGRQAPMSLAYVDLVDGPRILVHVEGEDAHPLPIGIEVVLAGRSAAGDITFQRQDRALEGIDAK